jgi:sRNA-binding carbon storage regulator CsrA
VADASTPYFSTKKPRMYGMTNAPKHETVYKTTIYKAINTNKKRRQKRDKNRRKFLLIRM